MKTNRNRSTGLPTLRLLSVAAAVAFAAGAIAAEPIRLHPTNPTWFQWRGRTIALITSAEHYGAVINKEFDIERYLDSLQRDGLNYTRIFAGTYVEPPGAFGIRRNTLAPSPGSFVAPWARSDQPGYAGGGNKFDLGRFSPEYLDRLRRFLRETGRRGIVVELTLFCATYGDAQWRLHPLNPSNNVQAQAVASWRSLHTLPAALAPEAARSASPVFAVQEAVTRWLVRELNEFDNLIYEIQNEPWADNSTRGEIIHPYWTAKAGFPNAVDIPRPEAVAWQRAIAQVIVDEESRLPNRHMIAQNIANFRLSVRDDDLVPESSILNFHYAMPEAAGWNRGLGRAIGCDETGFAGRKDDAYWRQAWRFLLNGGGLFNHLDYSFTVGHEDGSDTENEAPGGGSPSLRQRLRVLSEFLHGFDLARMRPDCTLTVRAPGVAVWALSDPGHAHAIYAEGRGPTTLRLNLAPGRWITEWFAVADGTPLSRAEIEVRAAEPAEVPSPPFAEAATLALRRQATASSAP